MPRASRSRKTAPAASVPDSKDTKASSRPVQERSSEVTKTAGTEYQAMQSLTETFESFRNDLTCKICFRLLYEPFMNSCGHTFCYSCLCQWFNDNPHGKKKTCPDCRATITTQPAPAYLIREFTSKLIQHVDSIGGGGETRAQHENMKAEEASLIEADRINEDPKIGGLFKGCFKSRFPPRMGTVRDVEDGVDRCPNCTWEIEDDNEVCAHCGYVIDDEYDEDHDGHELYSSEEDDEHDSLVAAELHHATSVYDDEDEDEDIDEELALEDDMDGFLHDDVDDDTSMGDVSGPEGPDTGFRLRMGTTVRFLSRDSDDSSSTARADEEEDEDDEDDTSGYDETDESMDSLLDDEASEGSSMSSESGSFSSAISNQNRPSNSRNGQGIRSRRNPQVLVDSEDDADMRTSRESEMADDSEDDPPIVRRARQRNRQSLGRTRRRPVAIDSDD